MNFYKNSLWNTAYHYIKIVNRNQPPSFGWEIPQMNMTLEKDIYPVPCLNSQLSLRD